MQRGVGSGGDYLFGELHGNKQPSNAYFHIWQCNCSTFKDFRNDPRSCEQQSWFTLAE